MNSVIVADAQPRQLARLVDPLAGLPVRLEAVTTLAEVCARVARAPVQAAVLASNLSSADPVDGVRAVRQMRDPGPAIVLVLDRAQAGATASAIAAGADDVLVRPFDGALLANKVELTTHVFAPQRQATPDDPPGDAPTEGRSERRRFVRQSVYQPMGVRVTGQDGFGPGHLLDVSEAAAKFQAPGRLSVADWVELDCPFLSGLLALGGRRLHTRVIRPAAQRPEHVYAASLVGIGEGETQGVRRWIFAEQARRVRVDPPRRRP